MNERCAKGKVSHKLTYDAHFTWGGFKEQVCSFFSLRGLSERELLSLVRSTASDSQRPDMCAWLFAVRRWVFDYEQVHRPACLAWASCLRVRERPWSLGKSNGAGLTSVRCARSAVVLGELVTVSREFGLCWGGRRANAVWRSSVLAWEGETLTERGRERPRAKAKLENMQFFFA